MDIVKKGADIKRSTIIPPKAMPNYPIKDINLIRKVTIKFLHHLNLGQMKGPYNREYLSINNISISYIINCL